MLEEAFDEQGIDSSEVRGQIEVAMRNGYYLFREHGKVTSWFMVEGEIPTTTEQSVLFG